MGFFLTLAVLSSILASLFSFFIFPILSGIFLMMFLFALYFFRDPERAIPLDLSYKIIAPADGKIIEEEMVFEDKYLKKPVQKIGIFMSIFDVHINRSPIQGRIEYIRYNKGKFFSAFKKKASLANEQVSIGIRSLEEVPGPIMIKLIAGSIARRIKVWKRPFDFVGYGERVGMIKFGSRVDLFLPLEVNLWVKKGEKIKAGKTIIGPFEKESKRRVIGVKEEKEI